MASTLPETMAGNPPADRLDVDVADSEADYLRPERRANRAAVSDAAQSSIGTGDRSTRSRPVPNAAGRSRGPCTRTAARSASAASIGRAPD